MVLLTSLSMCMDFKINKRDLFFIAALLLLSFFVWLPLLDMILRGNGYMYMLSHVQEWFWGRRYPLTGFSSAAAIAGAIFKVFFGANIHLYLWTELVVTLGIGVLFYWFVRVFTRYSIVAFAASLIFTVNYFGNFDMLVNTCYCYFMERVLNVPFLITSLICLQLFLEQRRRKFLIVSLLFFFIGVGLGHFSFLFTPIFFVYPFCWFLFKRISAKNVLMGIGVSISYVGVTILFLLLQQIHEAGFEPRWTFVEFLFHPEKYHYANNMLRQLVYWSQYPTVIRSFFDTPYFHQNVLSVANAIAITPGIALVYVIASVVIWRNLPKLRAMLFSVVVGTASIFFLNAYFGQYDIANQAGTNRYLYFPTFLLSIFWALFLWATFWVKKSWKAPIGLGLLALYYIINATLLRDNFKAVEEWNKPTKVLYEHIVKRIDQFDDNTLILAEYPAIKLQEAQFLTELTGNGTITIMSDSLDMDDWRPIASASSHIISLTYDNECECAREENGKINVAK